MNPEPIETSSDPDLRLSFVDLKRAALRAQELAVRTGTLIEKNDEESIEQEEPSPKSSSENA